MKKQICAIACALVLALSNAVSLFSSAENAIENEHYRYEIHRYSSLTKKWKKIADISDNENYTDKNLSSGVSYLYKVKPYKLTNGRKAFENEKIKILRNVNRPEKVNVKGKVSGKSLTIKWSKTNCSGYRIYMYKDGEWKPVRYISKNKTSYKFKKLSGKKYSFKVVPVVRTSAGVVYKSLDNSVLKVNMKTKKAVKNLPKQISNEKNPTKITVRIKNGKISLSADVVKFNLQSGYSDTAYLKINPYQKANHYEVFLKSENEWNLLGNFDDNEKINLCDYLSDTLEPMTNYTVCVKAKDKNNVELSKSYKNFKTTSATLFRVKPDITCYSDENLTKKIGKLNTNGLYTGHINDDDTICLDCFVYKKNAGKVIYKYVYVKKSDCINISTSNMISGSAFNQYHASYNTKDGSNSCGPSALACLVNYQEDADFTARPLRSWKYSPEAMDDLTSKAKKFNFNLGWYSKTGVSTKINGFLKSGKAVIVLLNYKLSNIVPYQAYGHYVVICGSDNSNYYVSDSLYHSIDRTGYEFKKNYFFSQGLRKVPKSLVNKSISKTTFKYTLGILN